MRESHLAAVVTSRSDEDTSDLATPEAIEPVVDFVAELGVDGAALEVGKSHVSVWTRVAEDAPAV